ncbi:hypothetical protein PHYSODRAFT_259536 [Phytophthora sojae]|uniref:BED-type domain-containing protein n=1 Tax=Phytophthora sojae (strain P6497) TaxID=1094619 RepID=G4Z5F1_PHYSP|nr:hypothetical protein PHYSODRAFT_259536 [Phytophthora sojae]EGZ20936.1 hypothetical protein PHYSODRAFT_259536 [Phytophthora sojae]|eukprot:XP_009523653.1 hypothetical protein PHYSODRAFT_259536 [Phytophthora sojae]
MPTNNPFSTRQVCNYYYKAVTDSQDEPTPYFRCQCSVVRKQASKTGYSNLFDHVLKRHPDFVATMMASGTNTATLVSFIDQKSQTVFCWLDWTTACNLPFSRSEDPIVAKYTNLEHLSSETLLKYAHLVVRQAEIEIDKVLLAFAPLIDGEVTDNSSASHVMFLEGILPFFDRDISNVVYLVGDNCAVNASSRTFWKKALRCGRCYTLGLEMIKRLFAIKDFIDTSDDELAELILTRHEENKLRALGDDHREFKSASKNLQSDEDVTLLDVRDIFDALIERHPAVAQYLAADAAIVKSPAFENACVKVLLGKEAELTVDEQKLLSPFAVRATGRASADASEDENDRAGFC